MKLIEGLYIAYYRFSNFFRENIPGSFFYNQRFDSILILSILTVLNFSSLWMLLDLKPLFTTHLFDLFLGLLIISGIFILLFERKEKYKELLEKYKTKSFLLLGWGYAIFSIGIFVFLHSRN